MRCLIAVVGPTAVGKSGLSMSLANIIKGEIVNADSRQVYRYMDIGTAKPVKGERDKVAHHLVDIIDPDEDYSLAIYRQSAFSAIESIFDRGHVPLLTGGSGQYVWSILENWLVPEIGPDVNLRRDLEDEADRAGTESLYLRLKNMDPASAGRIGPHNLRRIIRALEIHQKTGLRPSDLRAKAGLPYPVLIIGLTAERGRLYDMIDRRTDLMIEMGLVEEVRELQLRGYSLSLSSMSSLGYRQVFEYLEGKCNLQEAVNDIKYKTHRYARSQYAWFRRTDPRIHWFDIGDAAAGQIDYTVYSFLENCREPG